MECCCLLILCLNTFFSFQHFTYKYHSLYYYTLCYGKPVLVLYWLHKQYVKWLVVEFQCSSREWCGKPVVLEYQKLNFAILKELRDLGIKSGLKKFEIPDAITLVTEDWSPESGFVTSTSKVKRKVIQDFYQKEINFMYGTQNT